MAKKKVKAKRAGKAKAKKRAISKRELCKLCGCHSGKKWEECCGRCTIPC